MSDERLRLGIVDDHQLVRHGLRLLFEAEGDIEVVGEAATGAEGLELLSEQRPDVLLLDMRLPDMLGYEVCQRGMELLPELRVIMLTSFDDRDEVAKAMAAGAAAYVIKDVSPECLVQSVRTVAAGEIVLDPKVARRAFATGGQSTAEEARSKSPLSPRELEVLDLMARGMRNREIAHALWIAEPTVKTHVSRVIRKLGQRDRTQAVLAALEQGLVTAPNAPA